MVEYRRILVLKSGALGDLIAGTTAIAALRHAYPGASITVAANRAMLGVAPPGTLYDDLIATDNEERSPRGFVAILGGIGACAEPGERVPA